MAVCCRATLKCEVSGRPKPSAAANVHASLLMRDRFFGEQVVFDLLGERWIFAPNPLQHHGRVLLLLVPVVRKDHRDVPPDFGVSPLLVTWICLVWHEYFWIR